MIYPKEKRLREIIEQFENEYSIPNTALFNNQGLLFAIGFQKNYLDPNVIGSQGAQLFDIAKQVVEEILAKPHHIDKLRKFLKDIDFTPKRGTKLRYIILDTSVEFFDPKELSNKYKPVSILISPIYDIGFLLMIIEKIDHLALIKLSLPDLITKINIILNE